MYHSAVLRSLGTVALLLCLLFGTAAGQSGKGDAKSPTASPSGSIRLKHAEVSTALLSAKPVPGASGAAVPVKLIADAAPTRPGVPAGVAFKAGATADAQAALKGVTDFMKLRPSALTAGQRIEVTISGGDAAPADFTSSSFAAAVAVDSMLAGWTPDPTLAVIGALRADGDLDSVSSPIPRLLAAIRGGAQRVLLPEKMFKQVTDVLVSEGPAAFAKTQIFTISNFDDAPSIASASPDAAITRAIRRFSEVQRMLARAGADPDAALREPALKEALRDVLTTAPSHMSARLLLGRTTGQYTTLSIEGSLTALEAMCTTLLKVARSKNPTDLSQLPMPAVQAEVARVNTARTRLDAKAQPVIDALLVYADYVKAWQERPPTNASQQGERFRSLSAAARQILTEITKAKPAA